MAVSAAMPVPTRPTWFRVLSLATRAAVVGYAALFVFLAFETTVPAVSNVMERVFLFAGAEELPPPRDLAGLAGAALVAVWFVGPLWLVVRDEDGLRPGFEWPLVAALAGTVAGTLLADDAPGARLIGMVVAVVALRYAAFEPDGSARPSRLPRRATVAVVVVLGAAALVVVLQSAWQRPLSMSQIGQYSGGTSRRAVARGGILHLSLANSGIRTTTVAAVDAVGVRGGRIVGALDDDGWIKAGPSAFRGLTLAPGDRGTVTLLVRPGGCVAFSYATARIRDADGEVTRIPLGDVIDATC